LNRDNFNYVIGFSQADFLPYTATALLKKVTEKLFVECYSLVRCLPELLQEEVGLGCHTDVLLFTPTFGIKFFWASMDRRPFGHTIPSQCPGCHALKWPKVSLPSNLLSYHLTCRVKCGWKEEHTVDGDPSWRLDKVSKNFWGQKLLYGRWQDVEAIKRAPRQEF